MTRNLPPLTRDLLNRSLALPKATVAPADLHDSIAAAVHFVHDGIIGIAGTQKIGVQRMRLKIFSNLLTKSGAEKLRLPIRSSARQQRIFSRFEKRGAMRNGKVGVAHCRRINRSSSMAIPLSRSSSGVATLPLD